MRETARRAFVASLVVGGVVVGALALWKLRLVVALLFLAFTIAAAMRPGVEALHRRRVPRGLSIGIHYIGLTALLSLLLWLVVPRALQEIRGALGSIPATSSELKSAARESSGFKQEILVGLEQALEELTSVTSLIDPALEVTLRTFEILLGIFFTLACAAYWIFERDEAEELVLSLLPQRRRRVVRDTWRLIDLKLGAYVRGQGLLILLVGAVLSLVFWLIGLPYWLLLGAFAGVVEIVPVIGPLTAGALAVAVGLTVSWKVALAAGVAVLVVRLLEDYIIIPRVLGDAVGLSPLVVLVSVSVVAILFGGFAVLLAIPLAAFLATLIDVVVRHKDPAKEDVPAVLFPAKDLEA
jgi:predicted PurR-regulated permease PerM